MAQRLGVDHPLNRLTRVAADALVAVASDGSMTLLTLKTEEDDSVSLVFENELLAEQPGYNIQNAVQVSNDQIVVLKTHAALSTQFQVWKAEKPLDSPFTLVRLHTLEVPNLTFSSTPLLSILSLDVRVLVYSTSDGVLHSIKVDSFEPGPSLLQLHHSALTSLVQQDNNIFTTAQDSTIAWSSLENLADINQTQLIHRFPSPLPLYPGEVHCADAKLITFTNDQQLCMWLMHDQPKSHPIHFLDPEEYPRNLKPTSENNAKLLVETSASPENFSLYVLNNKGQKLE